VYADQECIENTQKITNVIDNILIGLNDPNTTAELKGVFGLPNVTYDNDFAQTVATGLDYWQSKNWDPATNDPTFDQWCGNITASNVIYSDTESLKATVHDLLNKGGYGTETHSLTKPFLNWIGWLYQNVVSGCVGESQDACFSSHNVAYYEQDDITQTWRSWPYQVSYLTTCRNLANHFAVLHTMGLPPNWLRCP
jgi:hypothetical protein